MTGDEIDVTKFPAPQWHSKDGGRYIGTGCYNIIRDPDEGWINCGTYRVMVHDEKSLGLYISPGKHGRQMATSTRRAGSGCRSPSLWRRSDELPDGLQRSALRGQRVRDHRRHARRAGRSDQGAASPACRFPANAEIVIEGLVEPGNERIEGPFGEWTGYYAPGARSR